MAFDSDGVEELIEGVDPNFTRFCPSCRLVHDPDPRIYFGAGRICPKDGTRLIGYLARFREQDGTPGLDMPSPWDLWEGM